MSNANDAAPREFLKVLFDLPPAALSPLSMSAWAKAINSRNFQDKLLRIFQYGGRALAFYMLKADAKSENAKKLTLLYKQLSLSRKGFRCCLWMANAHSAYTALQGFLKDTGDEKAIIKAIGFVQWATFSYSIFWDNMVFLTNPAVGVINQPKSLWFSANAVKEKMVNWRSRSDMLALCAALLEHMQARKKRDACKSKVLALPLADGDADTKALAAAEAKCHETLYPMAKYFGDIVTYLPQAAWASFLPMHTSNGWNDGHIGISGTTVAFLSCRSEWNKLK